MTDSPIHAILARLADDRAALREVADRDLGAVERMHPRLGALTGWQWVAALGGHEERHAAQVREIATQLATAGSERAAR